MLGDTVNGKYVEFHECDDGNNVSGDGCTADCKPEKGFICTHIGTGASTCAETCGDGRRAYE